MTFLLETIPLDKGIEFCLGRVRRSCMCICQQASQAATLASSRNARAGGVMVPSGISRILLLIVAISSVAMAQTTSRKTSDKAAGKGVPTLAEAEAFMKKAEAQIDDLTVRASRAQWVQENFITDDTETMAAQAQERLTALITQLALDARRFDKLKKPAEL